MLNPIYIRDKTVHQITCHQTVVGVWPKRQTHSHQHQQNTKSKTMATEANFLLIGLVMMGISRADIDGMGKNQQQQEFSTHFGPTPAICVLLWEDSAAIETEHSKMLPMHLLWGLHFLRCYPTEEELAARLKQGVRTIRRWLWFVIARLQSLLHQKVCCWCRLLSLLLSFLVVCCRGFYRICHLCHHDFLTQITCKFHVHRFSFRRNGQTTRSGHRPSC